VKIPRVIPVVVAIIASTLVVAPLALAQDTLVNMGSGLSPFSQNKQNEPAIAIDAGNPNVVVAGANDNIDMEACNAGDPTTCPFTAGVGGSGVYFSFDGGLSWTQPTYTGWTARDCLGPEECVPHEGPIGTVPGYFENGLVSDGDPALAFGPVPDENGEFSWENGSRLYYANLTANFPDAGGETAFKGPEAIAVARTDDVAAAAAGDQTAWVDPVIVTKQSSTTFSDKDQIWADNAASSPFFGNVYVCLASFRSNSQGNAAPQPLVVATSEDGGDSWRTKQLTTASNNPFNPVHGFGRSGCAVRTDSQGVVYVFANQFAVGAPGSGAHIVIKSFDGGKSWTRPEEIFTAVDTCFVSQYDGVGLRCVMDGIGGARDDLSSAPSVSIANGAPTGENATDVIYDSWVDGRDGLDSEHVFVSYSTDGGGTWSGPLAVEQGSDRGIYSAVALAPDGTDAYVVYNAFTTPFQDNTSEPRGLVGVVLHSDVNADGSPAGFSELHRGAEGDPRASAQNNLVLEFLGDYVYAAATNDDVAAVWNDVRAGVDCPTVDEWRAAVQTAFEEGEALPATPAPEVVCSPAFGNTDIYGGSWADPTP
jgi:hypothetical protein